MMYAQQGWQVQPQMMRQPRPMMPYAPMHRGPMIGQNALMAMRPMFARPQIAQWATPQMNALAGGFGRRFP